MTTAKKNCVLFIDDDVLRLSSHIETLQMEGFDVLTAADVESALKILKEHQFELSAVVLDMIMPVGPGVFSAEKTERDYTGLRLIKEIKKTLPEVPLVMCTVVHDPRARQRALALGASVYVTKPVLPSDLVAILKKVLGSVQKPQGTSERDSHNKRVERAEE